jgi:hypothetical protein
MRRVAEGEYSFAERDVDRLGAGLGQPPVSTLQAALEEKRSVRHLVSTAHGPFPHMSQFTLSDLVPQIPI